MRSALSLVIALPLSLAASCKSHAPAASAPPKVAEPAQKAAPAAPPASSERNGVFAPASPAVVSIWPEAYSGELLVVEVMPQGSTVKEGDVIAKLETRSIDEQVHQAELEASSGAIRHQGVVERNKIDDDAAASALVVARAGLDRAKRSLDGWTKFELAFAKRSDEIAKQNEDANIDDQKDELSQLEKMYKADELVDATEEIVLKRSKRRLDITEKATGLSGERRTYRVGYDEAMQTEVKQENARTQEQALDRLVRGQAIEKRAREDALSRSKDALDLQNQRLEKLKRDREKLVVHAPRAGVLLHGKEKDYRPGRTPARYDRGSQLAARTDVFLVADPAEVAVAFDIPESMLGEAREGAAVDVKAVAIAGANASGTLHLETYASTKVGEDNGYEATAKLASPIPGALFGMRARVTLPSGAAAASAPPAKAAP
jgi:hypothetical protein